MAGNELIKTKKKILVSLFFSLWFQNDIYALDIIPRLDMSETYNDNVALSTGDNIQDDYITQLNPGLNITGEGTRARIDFDYRMQNILYRNFDNNNDTYHQATLTSRSELAKNRFFLDLDSSFTQRNVSVSDSIRFDNLNVNEQSRSDVKNYRISPYYEQKIGKAAKVMLQYTRKAIDYEKNTSTILDSESETSLINIANGKMFRKLGWRITALREKNSYEGQAEDVLFEDSNLELKYQVGARSYVVAVQGYENNDYPGPQPGATKGQYWNIGAGWTPSKRTRLELRRGERYFGNTTSFSFSHEKSNVFWNLNYKEDVTTTSRFEFDLVDAGEGIILAVPVTTSAVFLSKALLFNVDLKSRRSTLAFNAFQFSREYLGAPLSAEDSGREENRGASLKLRWKVTAGIFLNIGEKWLFNTFREGAGREDNVYDTSLGLEYQPDPTSKIDLSYSNLERDSNQSGFSYKRNLLTLSARLYF